MGWEQVHDEQVHDEQGEQGQDGSPPEGNKIKVIPEDSHMMSDKSAGCP
jgi:hypothetical protein